VDFNIFASKIIIIFRQLRYLQKNPNQPACSYYKSQTAIFNSHL